METTPMGRGSRNPATLRTRVRYTRPLIAVALAALVATALLAAGSTSASTPSAHNSASRGPIIQINGPTIGPFYVAVKKGSDDAAKALGIRYQYSAPKDYKNVVADLVTLTRQAIARNPSALIVGDYVPSALDPLLKQATSKGIPVLVVNAGLSQWKKVGAIGFVGEDPFTAGKAAGDASVAGGVRNLLCVNAAASNPAINQRCNGAKSRLVAKGGKSSQLNIPTSQQTNPAGIQQTIQGYLRSHRQIDGIYMAASAPAPALAAVKAVGKTGKIKVGSADIWANQLKQIKNGQVLFAINQQPYLQGWYSLLIVDQYLRYRLRPPAAIDTGGLPITKANVDAYLSVESKYPNVLGPAG